MNQELIFYVVGLVVVILMLIEVIPGIFRMPGTMHAGKKPEQNRNRPQTRPEPVKPKPQPDIQAIIAEYMRQNQMSENKQRFNDMMNGNNNNGNNNNR